MRSAVPISAVALLFAVASCGSSSSGTSSSGGATGSGGAPGTGGAPAGSGGAGTGTGGSFTGTGGASTASGGASTSSGGDGTGPGGTGSGGSPATTGGAGTGAGGGTAGAAGGSSAGSGGTGMGGTSQGGRSGGGTGGAAGGASGGNLLDIVGAWDGAMLLFPCQDMRTGYDCTNVGCTGGSVTTTKVYTIGGQTGTVYNVTFRVRGVVETYAYVGGTRQSGTTGLTQSLTMPGGLFCSGGAQQPATNGGDYNTYELDVAPAVAGEANMYYLNSVIASENPHTSSVTQHLTFGIDYSATIKVTGGGTVTFKTYDSNCALVQNCGPTQATMCQSPRTVSLAGAMPAPPASFSQPYSGNPTAAHGQWVFFDITSVTTGP